MKCSECRYGEDKGFPKLGGPRRTWCEKHDATFYNIYGCSEGEPPRPLDQEVSQNDR